MFEEEIARGAEVLDVVRPGWELKIDFEQLDLANGCKCVLGQVFADQCAVETGANGYAMALALIWDTMYGGEAARHAFVPELTMEQVETLGGYDDHSHTRAYEKAWGVLDEEWISFIKGRLDKGVKL